MATDDSSTTSHDEATKREPVKRPASDARAASDGEKPRARRRWLRVLIALVVALVVVTAALAAVFAWDRWYRYDDAADFQGTWYPAGSTAAVEISADTISFDAETAYAYALDTHAKTVAYSLGNLQGHGRYWFADDRSALVIEDGDGFTARDTALADLGRMFANLGVALTGGAPALPDGEGFTVLTRTPDPAAVAAKAEAERQAKAAEEAAARAEQEAAEAEAAAAAAAEAGEAAVDADAATEGEAKTTDTEQPEGEPAKEEPKDFANESMGIL